eukprot:scaffold4784_cov388-Prasinococcus_capsulatus_cf.AAC.6
MVVTRQPHVLSASLPARANGGPASPKTHTNPTRLCHNFASHIIALTHAHFLSIGDQALSDLALAHTGPWTPPREADSLWGS